MEEFKEMRETQIARNMMREEKNMESLLNL